MNDFIRGLNMRRLIFVTLCVLATLMSSSAFASTDKKTLALVDYFLATPLIKIKASLVPEFLAIDPKTLPQKLRTKYESKRLELYALKKAAAGIKEGFVRNPNTADSHCKEITLRNGVTFYTSNFPEEVIHGMTLSHLLLALNLAHFIEVPESEIPCVQQKTQCSQEDMVCDFTLSVLAVKKGKRERLRYFLFEHDVLGEVVALCRSPGLGRNTNFFSEKPNPICSH